MTTVDMTDPPIDHWRSASASSSSRQSCVTDEGYYSDDKPRISWATDDDVQDDHHDHQRHDTHDDTQQNQQHNYENKKKQSDREIPIIKSTRIIRITYTPTTYTLTFAIILLTLHILIKHPPPWTHTFPPIFNFFHFCFHITHLVAHTMEWLPLERHCVVYGTWLFWTGWLLGIFVFSQRLAIDLTHPTTSLFWLLMLERRNAWGILVWEYVGGLDQNLTPTPPATTLRWWQVGSFRLLAFRIWCLLGTGSFWGLLYITVAKLDGYSLLYLLQFRHIMQLLIVSALGGLMMIIYWSFWTFQYRGILWQKELRKGVVVWFSEGLAFAGDVE
ncbi:hypothetical protein BC940DRAFT_330617 [Gongronella butleri]|nr:hypothetical protein BC940DRAFT_330617 [Gongronella butleri]